MRSWGSLELDEVMRGVVHVGIRALRGVMRELASLSASAMLRT